MKNGIKIFVVLCIVIVISIVLYWCVDIIPMYGYDSTTKGNIVENIDEKEICGNIINKKYETLLYYDVSQLNSMYINKYSEKIKQFSSTSDYEYILNEFHSIKINEISKKSNNTYIIDYAVCNKDNSENQVTTIIKFNRNMTRVVIVYDTTFEVSDGE